MIHQIEVKIKLIGIWLSLCGIDLTPVSYYLNDRAYTCAIGKSTTKQSDGTLQYSVNGTRWNNPQSQMEQSTITCLWEITAFSLSNIQPVQRVYLIYNTQPYNEAQPPRIEQ